MSNYVNIRKAIIDRQQTSRAIARRIRESKGPKRHELWLEKRRYGAETRHLLLAYALLRDVPYRTVERRSSTPPSPSAIADICACPVDEVKRWLEPGA